MWMGRAETDLDRARDDGATNHTSVFGESNMLRNYKGDRLPTTPTVHKSLGTTSAIQPLNPQHRESSQRKQVSCSYGLTLHRLYPSVTPVAERTDVCLFEGQVRRFGQAANVVYGVGPAGNAIGLVLAEWVTTECVVSPIPPRELSHPRRMSDGVNGRLLWGGWRRAVERLMSTGSSRRLSCLALAHQL